MAILLAVAVLAAHARAADPDTFDPAKRDPAWISPRAKAAEAKRRALHARDGDEWVARCATFLTEHYRHFMDARDEDMARRGTEKKSGRGATMLDRFDEGMKAAEALAKFTPEDAHACNALEEEYFDPRADLHEAVFARIFGGSQGRDGSEAAHVLDEYARVHGNENVAVLERHARDFALAKHGIDGGEHHLEAVGRTDAFDPSLNAEARAERSIRAALEHVAAPEMRDRYLEYQRRLAADPRLASPEPEPWSPFGSFARSPAPFLDRERRAHARAAVEAEVAQAASLAPDEVALFERLLGEQRTRSGQHFRGEREPNRKDQDERWQAYREKVGEAVVTFFEREQVGIDRQVAGMKLDAELAIYRPKPLPPRVDRPGAIRVSGTHPPVSALRSALVFRVEDARGHVTWSCEHPSILGESLDAPCLVSEGVFAKPGRYRFVAEGAPLGRIEKVVAVNATERRFDVRVAVEKKQIIITAVADAPGTLRLAPAEPPSLERIALRLSNKTDKPLRPSADTWVASAKIEFDGARGWIATDEQAETGPAGAEPLAPGATLEITFGARVPRIPSAVLRAVVSLAPDAASGAVREVSSEPISVRTILPSRAHFVPPATCIVPPDPPGSYTLPGFRDVVWSPTGALVADTDGIARIEGSRLERVFRGADDGLTRLAIGAGGRVVVARGRNQVVVSRDGGAHFEPLESGIPEPRALGIVGEDVLVLGRDGGAVRVAADGAKTTLELPKKVTWRAASFDGLRGALLGSCDTLLVTTDGGRTWETREAEGMDVLVHGERIIVAGWNGVRQSVDEGRSFAPLSDRSCIRLQQSGDSVALACEVDGHSHSPLLLLDGDRFIPVPSELPLPVSSVTCDPNGHLIAGGGSEVLFVGDRRGVQQVSDTTAAKQAMLSALRNSPPWMVRPTRPPRPRPPMP